MYRAILTSLLAGVAAGCTYWPEHGTGGMAEKRPAPPPLLESGIQDPEWLEMNRHLAKLRKRLDLLVAEGAEACLPAHVVEARLRENRIARELHGGLKADAGRNLAAQQGELVLLENRLRSVRGSRACSSNGARTFALAGPSSHQR
jgi:hypothetical protein